MNYYNHYKELHDSIKPLRGRSTDVRPIGKRRRDWEIIRMNGDVVECVLYQTPVVRYYPDGRIGVQCGGWASNSTADFMHIHSPFVCRKRDRKVQVNIAGRYSDDAKFYPLHERDETMFVLTPDNKWAPETPIVEHKQVIDRKLAKEARAPFVPFIKFMETFLKMSDGWLMNETREQVGMLDKDRSYGRAEYDYGFNMYRNGRHWDTCMLQIIEEAHEDDYLRAMCMLLDSCTATEHQLMREITVDEPIGENRTYKRHIRFYNNKYSPKSIKARLYRMVARNNEVHETKTVTHE